MNYNFKVGDKIVMKKDPTKWTVDMYRRRGLYYPSSPLVILKIVRGSNIAYINAFQTQMWVFLEDFEPSFPSMLERILE